MNKSFPIISMLVLAIISACQSESVPQPGKSVSPTASQSTQPSPSPSTSPAISISPASISTHDGCNQSVIICQPAYSCPVPSCTPPSQPLKIDPPLFIEESKFEAIKTKFSLLSVNRARDFLGGLSPSFPLAEGRKGKCDKSEGLAFYGGLLASCSSLLIQEDSGEIENLNNFDSFQKTFVPIDSKAEAVSYLAASTNSEPRFSFDVKYSFRFYKQFLNPTKVTTDSNGNFMVNMFYFQQFGCGPHPHFEVNYQLSKDGVIKELSREKLYEDPNLDGLCVD